MNEMMTKFSVGQKS